MKNNPHEIFGGEEDFYNWEKYIEQCDLIELSDENQRRCRESYQYLRRLLGEGFLKRSREKRYPMFFWFFGNAAPRARLSMISFANSLKALEGR